MKKHFFKKIILGFVFSGLILLLVYFVFLQPKTTNIIQAQTGPQIAGAPSSIQHKQSITISGAGFGTKSPAAPLIWDDFEDGIDPGWSDDGAMIINSDNNRHGLSTKNARGDFKQSSSLFFTEGTPSTQWYASFQFKLADNFVWPTDIEIGVTPLANLKTFRLWPPSGSWCNSFIGHAVWEDSSSINVENGGGSMYCPPNPYDITVGQWHLQEYAHKESSAIDVADGKARYWFDCISEGNTNALVTATTTYPAREKHFLIVGGFGHWWGLPPNSVYLYVDDVYVDNTWARVEIGNAATFAACTHREIQIPTAWNSGSITFTANQGSFANGATAYLYVVDADGNVNASGYPVTIGSGGAPDTTPPSAPTGVMVR